jgi:branched-subunit amino acid transport protein
MMSGTLLLTILGMALATYLTRAPLLLFFGQLRLTPPMERLLQALPLAILTALVTPLLFLPGGAPARPWSPEVLGGLVVACVIRLSGNLLLSVAGGVVTVALLRGLGW